MRQALLMLACFVTGLLVAQHVAKFPQPQGKLVKAVVTRVVDGDTIEAKIDGEAKPVTIRIIGYDAPETNQQPFGGKATLYLKTLLEGREVLLEEDVQALDKYGRRLYHVWFSSLVSEIMLLSGLGQQMTIPPNVRHVDHLTKTQQAARAIGLGIWAGVPALPQLAPTPQPQAGSDTVYITRTGIKFHRFGCRHLRYSAIPINRADAIARGYAPCLVCRP